MKRIFILGFMALVLMAGTASFAQKPNRRDLTAAIQINAMRASMFYKALTLASDKNSVADVLKTLEDGTSSGTRMDAATAELWLTDNTFAAQNSQEHYNAFYFMFLSDIKAREAITAQQLGKVKESDAAAVTSLRALMAFEILANADAERCGDPTVIDAVFGLVTPRYRDLRFALKTAVSKEQFDRYAFDTIDIESRKSSRPVNFALCGQGQQAATDPAYKPPVEESTKSWNEKRHELRTRYKTTWSDRYYKLREMK